ncbi:MAG: TolC family protein [Flavobacteriales bacterium]|nr:TolC family protein [Flavobacteriales bacterium]
MNTYKKISFVLCMMMAIVCTAQEKNGQEKVTLTLQDAISLATDSSLAAFRARHTYLVSYWEYRTYKAQDLPQLSLTSTPVSYNQNYVQRYIADTNSEEFRSQQTLNSSIGLEVTQRVRVLGGTFFINSDLSFYKNFSAQDNEQQFSSTPISIGYNQPLFGFNEFKWSKKIEPLKYEEAKRKLLYNMETIAENVTTLFFSYVSASVSYDMASADLVNADSLSAIGRQKYQIASISKADLLTLELDVINARNKLENAKISLSRARFDILSYLGLPEDTRLELLLPDVPSQNVIDPQAALRHAMNNNPEILNMKRRELEAQSNVQRTKVESRFSANLTAAVGFNQAAYDFTGAYKNLNRQDRVYLSLNIPLVDWGVARGRYNMARSNYDITKVSIEQDRISLEQDVIMTVEDFNIQQGLINSASQALALAKDAYSNTMQRFIIGQADVNAISLSLQRQNTAQEAYINALRNYWLSYAKIRRLTLYDYVLDRSLSEGFDRMYGVMPVHRIK